MRAAALLALVLAGCGDDPFLGSWRFSAGEAHVTCSDGSSPATYLLGPFTVQRDELGRLVADYVAGCTLFVTPNAAVATMEAPQTCDTRLFDRDGDLGIAPSRDALLTVDEFVLRAVDHGLAVTYRAHSTATATACTETATGLAQ